MIMTIEFRIAVVLIFYIFIAVYSFVKMLFLEKRLKEIYCKQELLVEFLTMYTNVFENLSDEEIDELCQ